MLERGRRVDYDRFLDTGLLPTWVGGFTVDGSCRMGRSSCSRYGFLTPGHLRDVQDRLGRATAEHSGADMIEEEDGPCEGWMRSAYRIMDYEAQLQEHEDAAGGVCHCSLDMWREVLDSPPAAAAPPTCVGVRAYRVRAPVAAAVLITPARTHGGIRHQEVYRALELAPNRGSAVPVAQVQPTRRGVVLQQALHARLATAAARALRRERCGRAGRQEEGDAALCSVCRSCRFSWV